MIYLGLFSLHVNHSIYANLKIGYDLENKVPTLSFDDMKIEYFKFDLVC